LAQTVWLAKVTRRLQETQEHKHLCGTACSDARTAGTADGADGEFPGASLSTAKKATAQAVRACKKSVAALETQALPTGRVRPSALIAHAGW